MSKEKNESIETHRFKVRCNSLVPHDARVYLDGKPLMGCTALSIKMSVGQINRVTLELLAKVEVDIEAEIYDISDIEIRLFKWNCVIDKETCDECLALHGKLFTAKELSDKPPLHMMDSNHKKNCRCYLTLNTK